MSLSIFEASTVGNGNYVTWERKNIYCWFGPLAGYGLDDILELFFNLLVRLDFCWAIWGKEGHLENYCCV